ncbi:hypothetical protein GCM10018779_58960 [Streptomyces griseocarneus]|nr:hypothetical protein GCM10018779_58960 [Streptomyces griseocarneus]
MITARGKSCDSLPARRPVHQNLPARGQVGRTASGEDSPDIVTGRRTPVLRDPQAWDSSASLEWARDLFTPLTEFFRGAASTGHAMLI